MQKILVLAAVLLAVASCSNEEDEVATAPPAVNRPAPPPAPEKPAVDPKLVARGKYLTEVSGCPICHTAVGPTGPDFAKAWAGGLEMPEKFGTWRSPNITQDKATGIGGWTDAQIIAAVREGTRPDGSKLYPIMPYLFYNRMTDDDAKAMVAYLRTLPAIENKVVRATDLKLPMIPAPKPANAPVDAADPMKQGEYLVTLAHCAFCHTPMDKTGAPDMKKAFAGGFEFEIPLLGEGKLYSSNITSDQATGIGKATEPQIVDSIKKLTKIDGTPIKGPMMFYMGGWSQITDDDAKAMAAYVKAIPAVANKVPKSTFKPVGPPPAGAGAPPAAAPPAKDGKQSATEAAPKDMTGVHKDIDKAGVKAGVDVKAGAEIKAGAPKVDLKVDLKAGAKTP